MDKPLSVAAKLLLLGAGGLAALAGPILFLFPEQTASYFAWTIKHPLTPVFMGANYLGGLGALWALRSNRWSVARLLLPGIFVFAITQLLATLFHIPIFNWGHPVAWAWLLVYITSPLAAAWVYLSMERDYSAPASGSPTFPQGLRWVMLGFALLNGLLGMALFIWPLFPASAGAPSVAPWWAWTLTPLTAQVIGGWYLAASALDFTLARQPVLEGTRPALFGLMLVTVVQLLGTSLHMTSFNGSSFFVGLYLFGAAAAFLSAGYIFLHSRSAVRGIEPEASS